jgi:predicted transcriptional regulator
VDPRLSTINKILRVLTVGKSTKCADIMTEKVIFGKPEDTVLKISKLMMKYAISQVPIVQNGKCIGTVTEESIIKNLSATIAEETVEDVMQPPLPSVSEETDIRLIKPLLEEHSGVLIVRKGAIAGIVTRSDLLKIVS